MAQESSKILDNTITRMEAVTARTAIGGRTTFSHYDKAWDGEKLATLSKPTRRFAIVISGEHADSELERLPQTAEGFPTAMTFDVVIGYKQGGNAYTLYKAISEDIDEIKYDLGRTDGDRYDQSNTGMWRRTVGESSMELDEGSGGTLLVTLPVTCDYLPTF